jgi:VanZ family protein
LVWLVTTFWFSTEAFSANQTSRFIVPALAFLFPNLSADQIEFWHIVIRKCAHITEYVILTMLACRSFKNEGGDPVDTKLKSMTFILMAALLDEWHQSFTLSRGASIVDVGYDCVGGVVALWLITTYETWRLRSHSIL